MADKIIIPAKCAKCRTDMPPETCWYGFNPKWQRTTVWLDPEPGFAHWRENHRCVGAGVELDTSTIPDIEIATGQKETN